MSKTKHAGVAMKHRVATKETAELLFMLEAALPFVEEAAGGRSCSSSGGPVAIEQILKDYDWDKQRWQFVGTYLPLA